MELDANNVVASLTVAKSFDGTKEGLSKAVQILERAVEVTETKILDNANHSEDTSSLEELLFFTTSFLCSKYWEIGGNYDKAAQTHRKCISRRMIGFEFCASWIKGYYEKADFQAVIDLTEKIIHTGPWSHFFADFTKYFLFRKKAQEILAWAAEKVDNWYYVDRLYAQAIEMAIGGNWDSDQFLIRVDFAPPTSPY